MNTAKDSGMDVADMAGKVVIGTLAGVCEGALGLEEPLYEAAVGAVIGTGFAEAEELRRRAMTTNPTGKGRQ